MARDHEVMIQDVNPLNARIYFDGCMYVGGRRHAPRPVFFAPYFTKECPAKVPEVRDWGMSCYSKVFTVREIAVKDLRRYPDGFAVDAGIRGHKLWHRWQAGLEAIAGRAKRESWSEDNNPHRLYFLLDEPILLEQPVEKSPNFPRLPWGFGMSLDRLKRTRTLP